VKGKNKGRKNTPRKSLSLFHIMIFAEEPILARFGTWRIILGGW